MGLGLVRQGDGFKEHLTVHVLLAKIGCCEQQHKVLQAKLCRHSIFIKQVWKTFLKGVEVRFNNVVTLYQFTE